MASTISTKYILLGWGCFAGTHLYMSHPPNREKLVAKVGGEKNFLALYSGVAFLTLVPMSAYYIATTKKFPPPQTQSKLLRGASTGLKTAALFTYLQSVSTPSPVGISPEQISGAGPTAPDTDKVKGIVRITRHALFGSAALFGLGNALISRRLFDILFYGGFPVFWIIGSLHQDYSHQVRGKHSKEFYEQTSVLPFQAILEGRNSLSKAISEFNVPFAILTVPLGIAVKYNRQILMLLRRGK